jgi:hypothetical protein
METTITVELVPTNMLTRWPCLVCGGSTDKEAVNAEFTDDDGTHYVCGECLRDPSAVRARLEAQAASHDAHAAALRQYAQRPWLLPSRDEWLEANRLEVLREMTAA